MCVASNPLRLPAVYGTASWLGRHGAKESKVVVVPFAPQASQL